MYRTTRHLGFNVLPLRAYEFQRGLTPGISGAHEPLMIRGKLFARPLDPELDGGPHFLSSRKNLTALL
jgi:hypothetical protein